METNNIKHLFSYKTILDKAVHNHIAGRSYVEFSNLYMLHGMIYWKKQYGFCFIMYLKKTIVIENVPTYHK